MDWRDEILSGLPSPRDDEPSNLRRDIEDELADHLACAAARELTRPEATSDEARRAVLARFGSPRLVAAKLYWDAMKEKIMKDRLMIVASILMLLTCAIAIGALWMTMKDNREANTALLSAIKGLAERPAPAAAQPAMPNTMASLKLTLKTAGGKPVTDANVFLMGHPFNETKEERIKLLPDGNGAATAGPIRPGVYTLRIYDNANCEQTLNLFASQSLEKTIVCPDDIDATPTAVRFAVTWPPELRQVLDPSALPPGEDIYLGGRLAPDPKHSVLNNISWERDSSEWLFSLKNEGLTTEISHSNLREDEEIVDRSSESGRYSKTIPLAPGKYRLVELYLCTGSPGKPIRPCAKTAFNEGEGPLMVVSASGKSTLDIQLPETMKKKILELYTKEQTLTLKHNVPVRFRDLSLTMNGVIKAGEFRSGQAPPQSEALDIELIDCSGQRNATRVTLSKGQSAFCGDNEITVEEVEHVRDEQLARVRLRYVPREMAGPNQTSGSQSSTTHILNQAHPIPQPHPGSAH